MPKERKINRWDRRRAKRRLECLKKTEKYQKAMKSLDRVNIKLPELNEKQRETIEKDLLKKKKR
jgi:hypothetical protein